MDIAKMEEMYRDLIGWLGEDPDREGLTETPHRAARAMRFLTSGYGEKPEELINHACFPAETNSMVIVRDIELYSLCEHHLLPFFGRCHIGYIPKGRVVGVSKLARLVDMYARRLQIQERLTEQIAHVIMDHIKPEGVGVIVEARHLCMMMRGVQKQNSMLVTSAVLGSFRESENTRHEFLSLIGRERSV